MTRTLPRFILGIDPGKRSGVALLDLMFEKCDGWEVQFEDFGTRLEELVDEYRPAITAETFVINAGTVKNTQAPWSLKALGVAEYLARKYGCAYEEQAQSSAKRFATNDRLKALGWYVPGRGHLVDGQRQALLYVVRNGWWHPSLDDSLGGTITGTDEE